MPEPEYVDPSKLRPGPIRNESLPPELLEHIGAIYEVIGQYLGTTLEQFEISFMRDMNPGSEVAIWCSITAAWIAYHERFLNEEVLSDDVEKKLISALIAISTGIEDVTKLGVPAKIGRDLFGVLRRLVGRVTIGRRVDLTFPLSCGKLSAHAGHSISFPLLQPQTVFATTFLVLPLGSSGSAAITRQSSR